MSHSRLPSTTGPGRLSRSMLVFLGLLLILSPLSTQAVEPRFLAETQPQAAVDMADRTAIPSLLPVALRPTMAQDTYFKASNTGAPDFFGLFMAISGDTMVVGAPNEASAASGVNGNQNDESMYQAGAAYVFVRTNGVWSQQAYLKASNPGLGDFFGVSVGISGDTIVVGARSEDSGSSANPNDNSVTNSGAAYVFVRNGTTWTQQAYLKASNPGAGDQFGETVFIAGSTVVVGASFEDSGFGGNQGDNSAPDAGAAYVYVRSGTAWSQQAYLKASNPGAGDWFSYSGVSISGETLVIGARGEDSAGSNQADNSATDAGATYVYVRNGAVWSQQAYLKASNAGANDWFGRAADIDGDTIVIGAFREDSGIIGNPSDNSAADAGAAYVFARSGTTWSQQAYLKASNAGANDWFGHSAALSGDMLVIGARGEASATGDPLDNSAPEAGAAYLFERSGATWSQQAYLKPDFSDPSDLFGQWVDLSGDTIVVGAPYERSAATGINGNQADNSLDRAGAVYSFLIEPTLTISDATVLEGDSGTRTMTFTATLSMPSSQPITATYATGGGTATAGGDYQSAAGTLRFAPGETVRTLAVTINGDLIDEPNETFSVTLSAPVNATFGDAAGLGLIIDDDAPPALSISDTSVVEGDSGTRTATFTATLTLPSGQPITATYATGAGTATAGGDYQSAAGTLRFAPGQTVRTLAVTITGDLLDEPDETFNVTLSAPINVTFGDAAGLGLIIDDDASLPAGSTLFLPRILHFRTQLLCVINANAIPIRVPSQTGEAFYTTTITIPAELPSSGHFYLSSSPTSAQAGLVDDALLMLDGSTEIFRFVYSASRPVPQLVEVPRATLEAVAGQPITVRFVDLFSGEIQSSPLYLIWQD